MRPHSRCAAAVLALLTTGLLPAVERPVADEAALIAAIATAQPGDVIVLRAGIWRDTHIRFEGEGTAEAPITLRAEVPGRTWLTGQSALEIGGRHLVVDGLVFIDGWPEDVDHVIQFRRSTHEAEDCRVTRCAIIDYNPPDPARRYFWVSLYGRRNRVDHSYFSGMAHDGVTLVVWHDGQPNDHRIDHNHFAHRRSGGGANGWETVRVGTSEFSLFNSRTVVESNLFEECNGEIEIISNKSGENIYRGNTFWRSEGMLTLRHGRRCVVDGNFFLGDGRPQTGGIRVIGSDHVVINNYIERTMGRDGGAITVYAGEPDPELSGYDPADRALIAFNTVVDVSGPHLVLGAGYGTRDRTVAPTGVQIANNVFAAGEATAGTLLNLLAPGDATWSNTVAHGRALGAEVDGVRVEDPRLERDSGGRWRPLPDSPLIDAAVGEYPGVTDDMDGQPRLGAFDIGADEVSAAPVLRRALRPVDVGPDWLPADRSLATLGGRLINLATRGRVGVEDALMIGGFVVEDAMRRLLLRGVGPGLQVFGVENVLADPVIAVFRAGETTAFAENDDWSGSEIAAAGAQVGAFALADGSADAALLLELAPGGYTVHLRGKSNATGVALIEVYELP